MAIARTLIASGSSGESVGTGSFNTGSFTPANNCLLEIHVLAQPSGSTSIGGAITVADNLGAGALTYTPQVAAATAGNVCQGRIFTAPVTTGASMQLVLDCGANDVFWYKYFVYQLTGHDTTSPVGATASGLGGNGGSNSFDGAQSITLSAAPASSSSVGASLGADAASSASAQVTPGADFTEDAELNPSTGTFLGYAECQSRTGSTSTTVAWVDVKGAVENFSGAMLAIEIKAAPAGPTPGVIATPAVLPAPTIISSPTVTPAVLATPVALPSVIAGQLTTVTPAVIATPVALPGVVLSAASTTVGYVKEVGSNANNSASTTVPITVGAGGVPVGDVITVLGALDNTGASGAVQTITVADNSSQPGTANTYTVQSPHGIADPGAASAGQEGFMAVCVVTRPLLAGDTITVTIANSTTAKAMRADQWHGVNRTTPVLTGTYAHTDNQTGTAVTVSSTPNAAGQAFVGALAVEGGTADSFTQDSDTTNGSWVTLPRIGAGTTTSGSTLNSVYKIVTASGAQTWNPTLGTARDSTSMSLVLDVISVTDRLIQMPVLATPSALPAPTVSVPAPSPSPGVIATPAVLPAPTITSVPVLTAPLIATPVVLPAPTVVLGPQMGVLATPVALASPTIQISRTATPAVIATPVSLPAALPPVTALFVTAKSSNGRYLVDQNGDPIFVQGASPQDMVPIYTPTDWQTLFADQAARGINAVQIHLMSKRNNADGRNAAGDVPWTNMSTWSGTSASTTAYWARIDDIIHDAADAGITCFLTLADNITMPSIPGTTDVGNYGTFLGNRYKNEPNIVWVVGNDWQPGQWSATQAAYGAGIDAIAATGDTHLVTVWLNYTTSISTDLIDDGGYTGWESRIDINAVYDYALPYHPTERAYARSTHYPALGFEWNYEGVHYHPEFGQSNTTRLTVRRDAWWCLTSGGCGQFFGQDNVIPANEALDLSSGALGSGYATDNAVIADVIAAHPRWYTAVPDTGSTFLTAGRGTHNTADNTDPLDNTYVTGGVSADGLFGWAYMPNWAGTGTLTVDVAGKITGTPTIKRIDPTTGTETTDSAPFTSPGNNAAGDPDWILTFEGTPPTDVAAPVVATPVSLPAPTVTVSRTATPGVIATPAVLPAPTISASGTPTPSVLATPVVLPAPTVTATGNVTPAVVATPVGLPGASITTTATVTPAVIATPVALPAPSITAGGSSTAQGPLVATPTALPAPTLTATATATPPVLATPVVLPAPTVTAGSGSTATPPVVATPIGLPAPTVTATATVPVGVVATPIGLPAPSVSTTSGTTATPPPVTTPVGLPGPVLVISSAVIAPLVATPVALPGAGVFVLLPVFWGRRTSRRVDPVRTSRRVDPYRDSRRIQ